MNLKKKVEKQKKQVLFLQLMNKLARAYRHQMDDEFIQVYWDLLQDYTISTLGEAIYLMLRDDPREFFPPVNSIIRYCSVAIKRAKSTAPRLMPPAEPADPDYYVWQKLNWGYVKHLLGQGKTDHWSFEDRNNYFLTVMKIHAETIKDLEKKFSGKEV